MLGTRQQAVDACAGDRTDTVRCERARSNMAVNATFGREGLALGAVAASLGTFPGLARFVSHQFMTGLGWLFVAMLAAMHVTREEARGTVGALIVRAGRGRFLAAKALSLWVVDAAPMIVATLVLHDIRSTFAVRPMGHQLRSTPDTFKMFGLHPLPPNAAWTSWSGAVAAAGAALVVLMFVVAGLHDHRGVPAPAAVRRAGVRRDASEHASPWPSGSTSGRSGRWVASPGSSESTTCLSGSSTSASGT